MAVGRMVRVLTDDNRKEWLNSESHSIKTSDTNFAYDSNSNSNTGSDNNRKIVISIFYPAEEVNSTESSYSSLYAPCEDVFTDYFSSRGVDREYLKNLKINIFNEAPLRVDAECLPVIIYSPGFGSYRDDCSFNAKKLVEHGYMVITIGHTYESKHTVFPDGCILEQKSNLHEAPSNPQLMKKLMEIRKADITFVLDSLEKINVFDGVFKDALDLDKIGLMGHSLGGAAVFECACEDARIKAVAMLDGALHRITSLERLQKGHGLDIPFINFRRDASSYRLRVRAFTDENKNSLNSAAFKEKFLFEEALAREVEVRQEALYRLLRDYKCFLRLKGAEHMTFTDYPLIMNRHQEKSGLSINRAQEIISEVTLRFFKEFLNGEKGSCRSFVETIPCFEVCEIDALGGEKLD